MFVAGGCCGEVVVLLLWCEVVEKTKGMEPGYFLCAVVHCSCIACELRTCNVPAVQHGGKMIQLVAEVLLYQRY